jgi:hypothetical protein
VYVKGVETKDPGIYTPGIPLLLTPYRGFKRGYSRGMIPTVGVGKYFDCHIKGERY